MRRILFISLILLQLTSLEAWADVTVIVRREAEATGNYVRVCDVARVEGPKEQAIEVGKTVLGPTPPKGQPLEITRWDIEARLFEMGILAKVSFSGNDMVKVFGSGERIRAPQPESADLASLNPFFEQSGGPGPMRLGQGTGALKTTDPAAQGNPQAALEAMAPEARERLSQIVAHYLAGQYKRPDVEIEAKLLSISEAVPYSVHEIKVEEAVGGRVPGKASLRLSVREKEDSAPRQVMLSADTDIYALAAVASKQLYKGDILEPRDVSVTRVKMESGKGYLPPNPKAAAGRELKRNLAPGEPLLASEATVTEAVKRGDYVQSITSNGAWEVRGTGKAMGGGMVGDVITVEDAGNKTKYQARITGRGTVAVLGKPMTAEPSKNQSATSY